MPYYNNIPQAGDAKSASQPLILANFQYLDTLVNGINPFILLPVQGPAPATGATQMALYTKTVGAVPAMFLRNHTSGTEVDFTTALKANPGWCKLPCGIKICWGEIAVAAASAGVLITFAGGGFATACLSVTATNSDAFGSRYFVQVNAFTTTNFRCRVSDSGGSATASRISYMAIGY